jgi:PAS domain S-box-containing protein
MSIIDPQSKQPSDELDGADPANRPSPPEQPSPSGKLRQHTLRFWLACLTLTCVLPIGFIVGFLVYYSYQQTQRALESSMLETARALSMVVDQQLATMQASATTLATAPSLVSGDLAAFHRQAQAVVHDYPDSSIVLADATGQQLVNTFVPFGTPLPKRVGLDAMQRVFETGKPVIINLFKGTVTGQFVVGVEVPVIHGGRVVYDISLTIPAERFEAIFSEQRIPTEWPSAIIDANLTVVARNRLQEKFVGTKIFPDFIKRLAETSEGFGEFRAKEGITVVGPFIRSTKTGWIIFIGVPKAVFVASVWRSLKWLVFGVILLSITAVTLALFLTQRIAASIAERKRAEEALREQAELLDVAHDTIMVRDLDGTIRFWNHGGEGMYGFSKQQATGRISHDLLRTVFPQPLPEIEAGLLREGRWEGELIRTSQDGKQIVAASRWVLQRDNNGQAYGVMEINNDITERKQGEEARARLAAIVESSADAIISKTLDGIVSSWNQSAERLFGYTAEEIIGQPITLIIPPDRHDEETKFLERLRRGDRIDHYETLRMDKSGRYIDVSVTISPILDASGVVTGISKSVRDITEQKRAEEAIRESRQQLQAIIDGATETVVFVKDVDGRFITVNSRFEKLLGITRDDVRGKTDYDILTKERADYYRAHDRLVLTTGQPMQVEEFALLDDGKEHIFLANKFPLVDASGKPYAVCSISADITERKQAEEALRQSEERWSTTLHSIGDAVIATDANGRIMFINEVAEKLTGWPLSEAQGRDLEEVFNIINEVTRIKPESPVAKAIRLGQVVGLANHTALIRRDGTELPIEDSGAPIRDKDGQVTGVVLVFHDISEKRRAEKALRDSERLAATGKMASTLAHEIHNPLDTVGALLYLINQSPDAPEPVRQHAAMASEEVTRVTQMTRHMLSFQREAKNPVPIKIGDVLDNVIALYERKTESAAIKIEKQVDFEEEFIGLPGEMRQMVANLVGNAIEAIGKNGKIRLHAYASTDWRRGRRGLRVTVADNGPGIPAEVRDKIFDPFFTTKGEAGTGLGLWIISGLIAKNDGLLRLRTITRDGRSGTCFSVFFPFPA